MKFDLVLDVTDTNFVEQLKVALGVKDGDQVQFTTPQFERTDGIVISYFPRTEEEFAALHGFSKETLKKMGLRPWDGDESFIHWLFPKEWYWCIPRGFGVVDINGDTEPFEPGQTDDDIRSGVLSYGFVQTLEPTLKPTDGEIER